MAKDSSARGDRLPGIGPEAARIDVGVAVVGFILLFLSGAAVMWGIDSRQPGASNTAVDAARGDGWSDEDSPIPVSSKDPVWGSRTAPVTIVQFWDFQCPYCAQVEPTIDQLKAAYGPDKIRIVWKNRPLSFHPEARAAAEAAAGVFALKGNDAFWTFHDAAFKNQAALSSDSYEAWARAAGVDLAKFKAGMAAHTWAGKVESDEAVATRAGVSGTPAAFINGTRVTGVQTYDQLKAVVDEELQKALAKIAAGTPIDQIYVVMSKQNHTTVPATDKPEASTTVFKVPVGASPVRGPATAEVTIVEFADFQCPYCSRVEPTLKAIRDKYGDKVRFVWKNEPRLFHPRAEPAAEVALEARAEKGDPGFWDVHDRLFASQAKLEDADLEKIAAAAGLNLEKVRAAMKTHGYQSVIDGDADLGDDLQANSTPHFFINGRRLNGAQPIDRFSEIIDEELTKAASLLANGTPAAQLYDALIKDGKGAPPLERKTIPPSPNAPARGNPGAAVTVVEFSDFQCPLCKRAEETVKDVMKNYGSRIRFVWRNNPLPMHPDASLAAQAAMEAFKQRGSDGFWKMHDLLYANQPSGQKQDGLKREALDGYARQIGLRMDDWKAALDSQSHKPEVDADAKVAGEAGIAGAPAFTVNGYFINGPQPYAKFRKVIERALAEAK